MILDNSKFKIVSINKLLTKLDKKYHTTVKCYIKLNSTLFREQA